MLKRIKAFLKNETGAETLEYVAIATVIIVLGIAAYQGAGIQPLVTAAFAQIQAAMAGA